MKRIFLIALTIMGIMGTAQAQNILGSTERKALKEFQDTRLPEIKKAMESAVSFSFELEVKWDQIAESGRSEFYNNDDYWVKPIFNPIIKGLEMVASDDIGKKNLKAKLKKIVVFYDDKVKSNKRVGYLNNFEFNNGVLTVNLQPFSNLDETPVKEKAEALQKFLESKI